MMTRDELVALAQRVLREGKPFRQAWMDEGDGESGPSGGLLSGVRWGRLRLEVSRNGSCYLYQRDQDGWSERSYTVFGSYMGSGHWGGSGDTFWVDRERQAIRDEVEARCKQA